MLKSIKLASLYFVIAYAIDTIAGFISYYISHADVKMLQHISKAEMLFLIPPQKIVTLCA